MLQGAGFVAAAVTITASLAKYRAQYALTHDVLENRLPPDYDQRVTNILWLARMQVGQRVMYLLEELEDEETP